MTGADIEGYRRDRSFPVVYQEETASTNDLAKEAAARGEKKAAFVATRQTAGRGRKGRTFVSPPGGLYLSYLLRPTRVTAQEAVAMTTAACVAVCRAIERVCGMDVHIKWVNDLYVHGKKVCGILTEAVTQPDTGEMAVIIGVGINVCTKTEDFPAELRETAGSLCGGDCPVLMAKLAAEVLDGLARVEEDCVEKTWLAAYRAKSMVLGRTVRCYRGGETFDGVAESVDDSGGLTLRLPDGTRRTLCSGEVTLRVTDQKK